MSTTPTLLAARDALVRVLAEHSEYYDGDCGLHFGCSCGWDNLADALLASGVVREDTP